MVQTLRRQSKGFQKTSSQYRGVTRHQKGKFEARYGTLADLFAQLCQMPLVRVQHVDNERLLM